MYIIHHQRQEISETRPAADGAAGRHGQKSAVPICIIYIYIYNKYIYMYK